MKPELILLRFGELILKGKNRREFENRVLNDIRRKLSSFPNINIEKTYGRVLLLLNGERYEEVEKKLQHVFGLVNYSPVWQCGLDLAVIKQTSLHVLEQIRAIKSASSQNTFKVSAKRANKRYPHNTMELNQLVGSFILKNTQNLSVDVHEPDIDLRVEVRQEGAFIYAEVIPGLGGLPFGSSGKAMLMLSGGIDSPVAGWLGMKRGLKLEAVHFHSYPYTSERAQQKVLDLAKKLAVYSDSIDVHMVPFTNIQTRLNEQRNNHLLITFMRRAMMRITTQLALSRDAAAIVTGESLGQVASQTLASIDVIGRATELPVLRPLITLDKQEIIERSKQIDTYETSILPYEDCCTVFIPKAPSTRPKLHIVERIESSMDWLEEEIEQAVQATERLTITADYTEDEIDSLF